MIHAFIDTNIFLSLYAYTDDNVEELKKLIELEKNKALRIYISTIINQEFYRNRDQKISESLGNLERFATSISLPRFMEHHEEAPDLRELLRAFTQKRNALLDKARAEIASEELAADKLFKDLKAEQGLIPISDAMEKAARIRMERGNPPGKADSIGDRLNWEMLLKTVPQKSDLHIVSRDKDFASPLSSSIPNSFLGNEWATIKDGKLFLYPGLKPFLKKHFPDIVLAADVVKRLAIRALSNSQSYQETHSAIAKLAPLSADLNAEEITEILSALVENPQVNGVSGDEDVQEFYKSIYTSGWNHIRPDLYTKALEFVDDDLPF